MLYRVIIIVYGLINIAGGLMAYLMPSVRSEKSLIVGGTAGLILIILGILAKTKPGLGFRAAAAMSVLLGGFWVYRINEVIGQGKSPGMAIMNLVLAIAVFLALGLGHMAGRKKQDTGS